MLDLRLFKKTDIPDCPGIKKLVRRKGDALETPIDPKLMKKINVTIEAFTENGETPTMQKFFFSNKNRALDPKKAYNNLPKGVFTCLGHLAVKEEAWFELSPEEQTNAFIQNYPIENGPLYLKLVVTAVVRATEVDPNNFDSYLAVGHLCREDGNELFNGGKISQAAPMYLKGAQILKNVPKKFFEVADGQSSRAKVDELRVRLLNNLSWTYIKLRDYTKALDAAEQALALDPHNEKANFRKGRVFEMTQEFEKALEIYTVINMKNRIDAVKDMQMNLEVQLVRKIARAFR